MDSKTNRYRNARTLVAEAGSIEAFAITIGRTRTRASSIAGNVKKPKPIGDSTARDIEKAFKRPVGWLDIPHDQGGLEDVELHGQAASLVEIYKTLSPEAKQKLLRHAQGIQLLDE